MGNKISNQSDEPAVILFDKFFFFFKINGERECVCVCVCVLDRGRMRAWCLLNQLLFCLTGSKIVFIKNI